MKKSVEFYRERVAKQPTNAIAVARYAHWAIAAALSEQLTAAELSHVLDAHAEEVVKVDDLTGPSPPITFSLGELVMTLGSDMSPQRIHLPTIDDQRRAFTFQLYPNGNPAYEVSATKNVCL